MGYTYPHEVEHRLFYKLFGDNDKLTLYKEVKSAFKDDSPMFTTMKDKNGRFYFVDHNFEELLTRFTQIKNALGIKEMRALTESELKKAYKMFKNGNPKIENNNMDVFFDGIKDWKAAAKLSGKALSLAGLSYTGYENINNDGNKGQTH